jgi:hypothetical protein
MIDGCLRRLRARAAPIAAIAVIVQGAAVPSAVDAQEAAPPELGRSGESIAAFVVGNVQYILLHELAHLVLRDFDVPVIGPEESAADYIATTVLIRAEMFDPERAARAQRFLMSTATGLVTAWEYTARLAGDANYWDTHALTIQRFYQIICLVYGSDEQMFADLPNRAGMPEARAGHCSAEYARASRALDWLLQSYGRSAGEPLGADVDLRFERAPTRTSQAMLEAIQQSGMLGNIVRLLRERFRVSEPFDIIFRRCQQPQALWLDADREVVLCYELLDAYYLLGQSAVARQRELTD